MFDNPGEPLVRPRRAHERPESHPGYVYLIGSEDGPRYKIGHSIDPAARLVKDIQPYSPVRLRLVWQRDGLILMEKALHREFGPQRLHGEWFDFEYLDGDPATLVEAAIERLAPQVAARHEHLRENAAAEMAKRVALFTAFQTRP